MIPQVLGCPLWFGRIKNRVAKKHLPGKIWRDKKFLAMVSDLKEGDLIRDCSSFNVKITKINPLYRQVGKGWVIYDIDITNDKGGSCSFSHCGVEPAWTRKDILAYWEEALKYWREQGDPWHFVKRYEFTTVDDNGVATVDYKGLKEKYGVV